MKRLLFIGVLMTFCMSAGAQEENKAEPEIVSVVVRRDRSKDEENRKARNAYIGQKYSELEMADVNGDIHKLSEYAGKGRWLFVDFWASWCGPCCREMPNVVAAYEKYYSKGIGFISFSLDSEKESWMKAIDRLKMPWTHLSDLKEWKSEAVSVYHLDAIPDNLLIDPQGIIVARGLYGEELQSKFAEIFGE